jgi:hypothetical protein
MTEALYCSLSKLTDTLSQQGHAFNTRNIQARPSSSPADVCLPKSSSRFVPRSVTPKRTKGMVEFPVNIYSKYLRSIARKIWPPRLCQPQNFSSPQSDFCIYKLCPSTKHCIPHVLASVFASSFVPLQEMWRPPLPSHKAKYGEGQDRSPCSNRTLAMHSLSKTDRPHKRRHTRQAPLTSSSILFSS